MLLLIGLWSWGAFAIPCDCEVRVHAPTTASHQMPATVIKIFQLEEYSNYARKNIRQCQRSCLEAFQQDMPADRLNALLLTHSMQLIEQKTLGFNCTGLTTLKYPVRVRAKLGERGLGNVADLVQVVTHEELCF